MSIDTSSTAERVHLEMAETAQKEENGQVDLREINDDLLSFLQDDYVKDELLKGVDLQKYAEELDLQLVEAEKASIDDYVKESDHIAELYEIIKNCDDTLDKMEDMLGGFQSKLGCISSEIKDLQDLSLSMNVKLKNRKETSSKLSQFIEGISLPPQLLVGIVEGKLDESYLDMLHMLRGKKEFAARYPNSSSKAASDILNVLDDLSQVAVARIRDFLVDQFNALQTPKTNIQIKQTVLVKFRLFFQFIRGEHQKVANEIRSMYVDVMSKIYLTEFKKYFQQMQKVVLDGTMDRHTTVATTAEKTGGVFASKKTEEDLLQSFFLTGRENVLGDSKNELESFVALQGRKKVRFEYVFNGILKWLMNASISEYLFLVEFFGEQQVFLDVFGKTISTVLESLEDYLFSSFDGIAVIFMIQVLRESQLFMSKRRVACLDHCFERMNSLLWPKFTQIIDNNLSALAKLQNNTPNKETLFFIANRFSNLYTAIAIVNLREPQEILFKALGSLSETMLEVTMSAARKLKDPLERSAFLLLCYEIICRRLKSKGLEEKELFFFEQMDRMVGEFVGIAISSVDVFNRMVLVVNTKQSDEIGEVVDQMNESWKKGLEVLFEKTKLHFSTEKWTAQQKTALEAVSMTDSSSSFTQVLKKVMTQIVVYYHKFQQFVQENHAELSSRMISQQILRNEIKRYRNR